MNESFLIILQSEFWKVQGRCLEVLEKLISKICPIFMIPENNPVDEEKYLGDRKNNSSIYEKGNNEYIYPVVKFSSNQVKIEKLCLIDFKGDAVYKCMELQQVKQENSIHHIVLMARQDGESDVYYTKGLKINGDKYKSLLNKVSLYEVDSMKVHFDVTEKGMDLYLSLKDKQKRTMEFKVKENKREMDSFGLIAPVGSMSESPDKFPVIYLKKFNMVEQKHTDIFAMIDEKSLKPIKLFPLYNFKRVYLARYSFLNNINELNSDYAGVIEPVKVTEDMDEIMVDDCIYLISRNNGHPEIKCMKKLDGNSEMKMTFSPPIPDIISLKDSAEIAGRFSISVDEVKGIMGGAYFVKKNNDSIMFQINPRKGWQPMPGMLWMRSYLWNCDMKIADGILQVNSKWSRTK